MPPELSIKRLNDLPATALLMPHIDAIFFQSSNTQVFKDHATRDAFRNRWIGQYLDDYPDWTYVALTPDGAVAGYLAASLKDPSRMTPFATLAYWPAFEPWTKLYPAHLHVNIAPEFRSRGVGSQLIERFAHDAQAAGSSGMHVVTGSASRNVEFYRRNGFTPRATFGEGHNAAILLAREFMAAPR